MNRELDEQEQAILTEGICPVCQSEVDYLTSTKLSKIWKCVNPNCNTEFHLEKREGDRL